MWKSAHSHLCSSHLQRCRLGTVVGTGWHRVPGAYPGSCPVLQHRNVVVSFEAKYETRVGQRVVITGGSNALGNWNPEHGLALTWSDGHIWKAQLTGPKGSICGSEFKVRWGCAYLNGLRSRMMRASWCMGFQLACFGRLTPQLGTRSMRHGADYTSRVICRHAALCFFKGCTTCDRCTCMDGDSVVGVLYGGIGLPRC